MKIQVLDHGYVEFIEAWGHGKDGVDDYVERRRSEDPTPVRKDDFEAGIIEAARQSTQGSFRGWEQDQKLLSYLFKNNHATPFEFSGMVIEVQAPIFVFREWHRHRTQSYNEMSARYAPLPDLYYVPTVDRVMMNGGTNKQAQSTNPLSIDDAEKFCLTSSYHSFKHVYDLCEEVYKVALDEGIPKELARLVMPVGHYSRMRASANLRCWLQFLTLRMDPRAQWEIRQFANAVFELVEKTFAHTAKLFKEEWENAN